MDLLFKWEKSGNMVTLMRLSISCFVDYSSILCRRVSHVSGDSREETPPDSCPETASTLSGLPTSANLSAAFPHKNYGKECVRQETLQLSMGSDGQYMCVSLTIDP